MKLIHCADLHLDSAMSTHLSEEKRRQRRAELLHTFERMVDYAVQIQAAGILIAGDLFDKSRISAQTKNVVMRAVSEHPELHFYYLKGNHDRDNFVDEMERIPDNLFLFGEEWTRYEEADGKVIITGKELTEGNVSIPPVLDRGRCNIVMLHGQESEGGCTGESVDLRMLSNRGIDYLALGHIHAYKLEELDGRGVYCYPGCLEGRGFDECGEHGFVVLSIDEESGKIVPEFVPFASRKALTVPVDVTGCEDSVQILFKVRETLADAQISAENMVKIILRGELNPECECNLLYLETALCGEYFFTKVSDETRVRVDMNRFLSDQSLRGEFVRLVMGDASLTEEEKSAIIRMGLQALAGEEVQ